MVLVLKRDLSKMNVELKNLFRIKKYENLKVLIANQMQLIRKLPTLHNKAFESYITSIKDSVDRVKNLSMSFSQFSSYVAFLNDKVLKNELEFRKNSYKNDMELVEV